MNDVNMPDSPRFSATPAPALAGFSSTPAIKSYVVCASVLDPMTAVALTSDPVVPLYVARPPITCPSNASFSTSAAAVFVRDSGNLSPGSGFVSVCRSSDFNCFVSQAHGSSCGAVKSAGSFSVGTVDVSMSNASGLERQLATVKRQRESERRERAVTSGDSAVPFIQ